MDSVWMRNEAFGCLELVMTFFWPRKTSMKDGVVNVDLITMILTMNCVEKLENVIHSQSNDLSSFKWNMMKKQGI